MKKFVELQSGAHTSELHHQFSSLHFHVFGQLLAVQWRCSCLAQLLLQAATDPEDVVKRSSYLSKAARVEGIDYQLDWQKDDVLLSEPIWDPDWITCRVKTDDWAMMFHCNLVSDGFLTEFQGDEKAAKDWLENLKVQKTVMPHNVFACGRSGLH